MRPSGSTQRTHLAPLLAAALAIGACQPAATAPAPSIAAARHVNVAKGPHGLAAAAGFVYAGAIEGEAISVIDTATDTLVKEIARPGGQVVFLAPFPDGRHVLALDNRSGEVLVIDPAQDHRVLQTIAIGRGPDEAAFTGEGDTAVIALADEDKIVSLSFGADRAAPPAVREFAVGTAAGDTNRHRPLAARQNWALVPNTGDNTVTLTDLATGQAQARSDGNNPGPVGIAAWDGRPQTALVGYRASHSVVFYDLPSGQATKLDGIGQFPQALAIDDEARRAYVVMSGSNELSVLDIAKKRPIGRVPLGSRPVEILLGPTLNGTGKELWVGNDGGDSVSVVDAGTLTTKATVGVQRGHHHLAFWGDKAYVSNLDSHTISVIDRSSLR